MCNTGSVGKLWVWPQSSTERESSVTRNSEAPGATGAAGKTTMDKMHSKLSAAEDECSF